MIRIPKVRTLGFSLIELMVTVSIVGVLASIAYPSYLAYTRRSNRTDATSAMVHDAQMLERCYSQTFSYIGCPNVPTTATPTPNGYYSVLVATPAAAQFTITATPAKSPQTGDTQCSTFTMGSGGVQTATDAGGALTTSVCWGSK